MFNDIFEVPRTLLNFFTDLIEEDEDDYTVVLELKNMPEEDVAELLENINEFVNEHISAIENKTISNHYDPEMGNYWDIKF
jgi:hypothetical protein